MTVRAVATLAVGVLVCFDTGPAGATEAGAEALFRAGREALKQGDDVRACDLLRESERIEPAPGTELNLAFCEERLKRWARAWQLLQQVLHTLPRSDPRREIARLRVVTLERRIARVTLEAVPGLPADTRVRSADAEYSAASFGVAIPVDPGPWSFTVRAPGRYPRTYDLHLAEGEHRRVRVEPGEAVRLQPLRAGGAGNDPSATRPWAVVAAGSAVGTLSTSIVLGLGALRSKAAMDAGCAAEGCSPAGLSAADRGETLALASTATFVGALVLGAVSTLLFVRSAGESRPKSPNPSASTRHDASKPQLPLVF